MHKWGNQGTERLSSPLLSSSISFHPLPSFLLLSSPFFSPSMSLKNKQTHRKRRKKKKKGYKWLTSTSIKPRLSEGKPSTAVLPGNPLQGLGPPWALVTTPGVSSKPHSSSTSTGRVPEPLYLGMGCGPQSALLRTCTISGKKIYVLYVAIFPRAPLFFSF